MKIEKLTEDKIRVILNFSDLEKNHIDAKSVFSRTLEYHDFFMNLLEQAKTEVGFSTDGCRILIEALSTSDEYLVFTITKYLEPSSKGALPLKRPCVKRKSLNNSSKKTIYKFDNFDYFCDFCEYLKNNLNMKIDKISKASSLYFYKNTYYLIFNNTKISQKLSKLLYITVSEFLSPYSFSNVFENKLFEYGKLIIKSNAINTGIKYFL